MDVIDISVSKKYTKKLSSGISNSTYDPSTSTMTVNLSDGTTYDVVFDDGITTQDRELLNNMTYNPDTDTLEINGQKVLTVDESEQEDDIDFSDMF